MLRGLVPAAIGLLGALSSCSGSGPFSLGSDALQSGAPCGPHTEPCPESDYCDFAADGCSGVGVCRPRSSSCSSECQPVCGCDGVEYCNACAAQTAGVDVGPSSECASENPRCGGWLGERCPADEFCDFGDASCGQPGATGRCQLRPLESVCPAECTPACGCDGQPYCNECFANAAGIDRSLSCP
jgi:hypothetical protein